MNFSSIGAFRPAGDLWTRLHRNYTRLEEERYWPENVYQREKAAEKWPGDIEGRTLLSWILLAQATGREPRYLDEMLARWPEEVNERGYFGRIYTGGISEQQLSGHGWMLQALAELERWRPGGGAREKALPIIENLFLPTAAAYAAYPVDPAEREAGGEYAGTHAEQIGAWILSTDIGCFAIGMTGLIDACEAFGLEEQAGGLIEAMIERFLAIDLAAIGAQTHATLTGCRGLLRRAGVTGQTALIEEAAARYRLYTQEAWTESYANFNWFGRPQWTEPCAVVDSLMVAMELWRHTRNPLYLEQAQLIWFNALGHGQRANGGFGCENCPGADGEQDLFYKIPEAHWCCTMRGSEGLARMTQYAVAVDGRDVLLPFGLPGEYADGEVALRVETTYPRGAAWTLTNRGAQPLRVRLFLPRWVEGVAERGAEGWVTLELPRGGQCCVKGTLQSGERELLPPTRKANAEMTDGRVRYAGPLLLADYGDGDWQPICADYLRGNMDKDRSAKRLIQRRG